MTRLTIEQYLDGELTPAEAAALLADPASATLIQRAQSDRALRAAVYASYQPSPTEAQALSSKIMSACAEAENAPVGYIGRRIRYASAVAAVVALVIGGFMAGRITAPTPPQPTPAVATAQPTEIIRVLYNDDAGEPAMKEFDSSDEANSFMKEMNAHHAEPVVVATGFDTDHPGSF
jgi:anti-sigma factor RsiW